MSRNGIRRVLKLIAFAGLFMYVQQSVAQQNSIEMDLNQAIQIALKDNKTLKIANSEIERIDYLQKEAWYTLFPTISAGGQYTNNLKTPVMFMPPNPLAPDGKLKIGVRNAYSVSAQASLPLFAMGIYRNIQLSELELQDILEGARSSKIDLIKEVKNTFYGILMAQSSYDVMKKSYEMALETAENIKKMYEQGLVSEYDQIRSEVTVRNILPMLTQIENSVGIAKRQMKILLSLPVSLDLIIKGELVSYESDLLLYTQQEEYDLTNNTHVRSLDIKTKKLQKQLQLMQSQRIPTLGAFANYQSQAQNEPYTFSGLQFANSFAIGLNLSIPIFSGFTKVMKEKQLKVSLSQMQLQKELLQQNLSLGIQNALYEISRTKVQLESNKEAARQAEKGYEIAKVRYNTGTGTVLELNDADNARTQSMLNYNQSIYDYLKAKNELETFIGSEDIY